MFVFSATEGARRYLLSSDESIEAGHTSMNALDRNLRGHIRPRHRNRHGIRARPSRVRDVVKQRHPREVAVLVYGISGREDVVHLHVDYLGGARRSEGFCDDKS